MNLDNIPDEILLHILSFLPIQSLFQVSLTCVRLYRISRDQELWNEIRFLTLRHLVDDNVINDVISYQISDSILQKGRINRQGSVLSLSNCSNISDDSLNMLSKQSSNFLSNTKEINFDGCSGISNLGFLDLLSVSFENELNVIQLRQFDHLQSLSLDHCHELTSEVVAQFPLTFPNLKSLNLRGCDGIDDNCLLWISNGTWNLEKLNISLNSNITDIGVSSLFGLDSNFHRDNMPPREIEIFQGNFIQLIIPHNKFLGSPGSGLFNLKHLDISFCVNLTGTFFNPLCSLLEMTIEEVTYNSSWNNMVERRMGSNLLNLVTEGCPWNYPHMQVELEDLIREISNLKFKSNTTVSM